SHPTDVADDGSVGDGDVDGVLRRRMLSKYARSGGDHRNKDSSNQWQHKQHVVRAWAQKGTVVTSVVDEEVEAQAGIRMPSKNKIGKCMMPGHYDARTSEGTSFLVTPFIGRPTIVHYVSHFIR
ncbi:unnamed protein product, partial [Scytosiphon promiscuus]